VPPLTRYFNWSGQIDGQPKSADAVSYTAASGARVFSAGTLQYAWALDNYRWPATPIDQRLQRFTVNVLDSLATAPAAPPAVDGGTDPPPKPEPGPGPDPGPGTGPAVPGLPPPTSASSPETPPPACSVSGRRRVVRHRGRWLGLRVKIRCDQDAKAALDTTLREVRWQSRHHLALLSHAVTGGKPFVADVRLGRRGVRMVTASGGATAELVLAATGAGGSSTSTAAVGRLELPLPHFRL
jgi:hypothetical protein